MLGTDELTKYLNKYKIVLDSHYNDILGRYPAKPLNKFITPENSRYISDEAIHFCEGLLKYDHQERFTPREAMNHPYFGTFSVL